MYDEWYGVCDFVVFSVVEVCADYGDMNVFQGFLDFCVVYGVGVLCQFLWCSLLLISEFRSEIVSSHAFCAVMLFLCSILVCMWSVSWFLGWCICLRG